MLQSNPHAVMAGQIAAAELPPQTFIGLRLWVEQEVNAHVRAAMREHGHFEPKDTNLGRQAQLERDVTEIATQQRRLANEIKQLQSPTAASVQALSARGNASVLKSPRANDMRSVNLSLADQAKTVRRLGEQLSAMQEKTNGFKTIMPKEYDDKLAGCTAEIHDLWHEIQLMRTADQVSCNRDVAALRADFALLRKAVTELQCKVPATTEVSLVPAESVCTSRDQASQTWAVAGLDLLREELVEEVTDRTRSLLGAWASRSSNFTARGQRQIETQLVSSMMHARSARRASLATDVTKTSRAHLTSDSECDAGHSKSPCPQHRSFAYPESCSSRETGSTRWLCTGRSHSCPPPLAAEAAVDEQRRQAMTMAPVEERSFSIQFRGSRKDFHRGGPLGTPQAISRHSNRAPKYRYSDGDMLSINKPERRLLTVSRHVGDTG